MFFNAVNRGDKDAMFSIGQTLRIRVGPLKGYLCRVLAIRHSDVMVKLDSQHKVLTGLLMMVSSYSVGFGFFVTGMTYLHVLLFLQLKVSILLRFVGKALPYL